jgi:4-aminobutyrate aminotransferase-like enzyme
VLPEIITDIPGPKSRALAAQLRAYESPGVTHISADGPIFWARAAGANVWDADGNRFLDLDSGFGVAGLGHTNGVIANSLADQAHTLMHAMGDMHPAELKAELCAQLSAITFERWHRGPAKAILGNSGFEAVEAALKTSILYSGKAGVVAFSGAYHGLGYGALETGGIPFFRDPFRPQLKEFATIFPYPYCYRCPYGVKEDYRVEGGDFPNCSTRCLNHIHDELVRTLKLKEIGCILVEPVQGRGGNIVPPIDFLRMLRQICDEHRLLLIADEIFTGFNRTGALWACDHFGIQPDIICLGKGLTGGFPLSACVGRAEVMDAWPRSEGEALHTSTFLGNPLGCRMALAAIEQHRSADVARKVREQGARVGSRVMELRSSRQIHVRGAGLMLGLELSTPDGEPDRRAVDWLISRALREGLILVPSGPAGNVIGLAPPFDLSEEEIDFAMIRLQEYLTSLPGSIS